MPAETVGIDCSGRNTTATLFDTQHSGYARIQIAQLSDCHRAVRDSKHPTGPALIFTAAGWAAFTASVRDGEFD